ncbi:MAG: glycoside hydrolase family 5 protein [Clostridia bacterium]|nr:glycoside hydrolase family 5 protein [Clostridia bacterium]
MDAFEAVRRMGAGWCLGNTLDAMKRGVPPGEIVPPGEAETAWHNPPASPALFRAVREAGFGAVRVPVTWIQHMDAAGRVDPAWMDRVEEVVRDVLDAGLFCLLNVHHDAGSHGWLQATGDCHREMGARFDGLWRQIAERFAETDGRLIFEGFNEMLDGRGHWTLTDDETAYAAHNRWNQRFVDTVRSAGGMNAERVLSVQTYSAGNAARTLEHFRMPADTVPGRIILQTHNYDPEGFCWRRAENRVMRGDWGGEEDEREQDRLFDALGAFAAARHAPLIVGEFGSEDKTGEANRQARARHAGSFTRKAGERGIACFWWDCGWFALFDRRTSAQTQPEIIRALTKKTGEKCL